MHKSGATFGSSGEQYDGGSLGIERNRPDIIRISLDRHAPPGATIEPCRRGRLNEDGRVLALATSEPRHRSNLPDHVRL